MKIQKRTVNIDERLLLIDTKDVSTSKKILLTYITNFLVNNDTLFTTNNYLAKRLNMHPSTVSTAINEFFEREWVGKFEEHGKRHIYQTERHLENIDKFLGDLKAHAEFLKGLTRSKDSIKERIAKEEEEKAKALSHKGIKPLITVEEEKTVVNPKESKPAETTSRPELQKNDLTEKLIDTTAGVYIDDEEFNAEMERIWQSRDLDMKNKESDFNAMKWLKSSLETTGYEFNEDVYQEVIKEVETRLNYKPNIIESDYLSFFRGGNFKEPNVGLIGDLILEANKRKNRIKAN